MKGIHLNHVELSRRDKRNVMRSLANGHLSQGPVVQEFEDRVRGVTGAPNALAVSSCTAGLHLILAGLGLSRGDEVIVPDFTFPATINTVIQQGCTPVLVDINSDTFCIDVEAFKMAITDRTKAVVVVHAFGHPANMFEICRLADSKGILVIEDAACAIGASIESHKVGTFGIAAAFSFHPRKIVTTGEGGVVICSDPQLAERMRLLRSHGGQRGPYYLTFVEPGFNYRMSDLNAALGIPQIDRLEQILRKRRELAHEMDGILCNIDGVTTPKSTPGFLHTYQSYVVQLDPGLNRDQTIQLLRDDGIESTLGTYSMHQQPAYARYRSTNSDLGISRRAYEQTLALPIHSKLTTKMMKRMRDSLLKATQGQS